jgi:hypothetical protein
MRNEYTISVEKPEGKYHLGSLGLGRTILFIRNIIGIGCENVAHSSVLEQGLVAGFNELVMNLTVPQKSENLLIRWATTYFISLLSLFCKINAG